MSARARAALGVFVPDVARGVRAACATLVPFYFARTLGRHTLVWIALGGWLGTLADPGGARGSRAKTLASFALAGAVVVALADRVAPSSWAAAALLAAVAFAGSLLRALGAAASGVGTLLVVTAAIAVGGQRGAPLEDALAFAGGAAWATVLSSVVWPVWTHLRMRHGLAEVFRALAGYARAIDRAVEQAVPEHDAAWVRLARTHQRRVRDALEDARAKAVATRARRAGESVLGSNLRTLLGAAETQLPLLVALAEELESMRPLERASRRGLAALVATYTDIAGVLEARTIRERDDVWRRPSVPPVEHAPPASVVLLRRLSAESEVAARIASALGARTASSDEESAAVVARRALREDLRTLRDALSLRSTYFRHALRVMLAVSAAQIVGRVLSPSHAQWVTVTTIAVLQPYPGATVARAIERVAGTVLGSVVAVAIIFTVHDPLALAALMVPLSVAAVATRPRSHRLFTFFLTPVFVLLAERWHGDWWIAAARSGDALLGGAIALVAALVFPSREEKRLSAALDAAVAAVRRYAEVVVGAQLARTPASPDVVVARREVGVALGAAETSLERMLGEPLRSRAEAAEAMLLVTHVRRLAAALTTLDARQLGPESAEPLRVVLSGVVDAIDPRRLRDVASGSAALAGATPDAYHVLARIARQADLVGASLASLAARSPPDSR
ncbi:MAG: FUSC family protein [Labilithrix sp.]|nr:FUSC family protein [Labilithrix sp.]